MNRNYALEFVRATELAAIASARWLGRGDEKAADQAAVDAMRALLNTIDFRGEVVIGEGERDEAPMLYIGEKVGTGEGEELDIALDPLEGTTITSKGSNNATSVIAVANKGCFLNAPDTYMDKIAVGPECFGILDINASITENIKRIADRKKKNLNDTTAIILDRPRHVNIVKELRSLGVRIYFIGDGDVNAAIATCIPNSGVDVLFGTGGAPEGVISAAALKCLGGDFIGRLHFRNDDEKSRAKKMGISDLHKVYQRDELAKGDVMFSCTGVSNGTLLKGVLFKSGGAHTNSLVMRSRSGTIRYIDAEHSFNTKPKIG